MMPAIFPAIMLKRKLAQALKKWIHRPMYTLLKREYIFFMSGNIYRINVLIVSLKVVIRKVAVKKPVTIPWNSSTKNVHIRVLRIWASVNNIFFVFFYILFFHVRIPELRNLGTRSPESEVWHSRFENPNLVCRIQDQISL